jgi:Flp pilus assembly pilin Flp
MRTVLSRFWSEENGATYTMEVLLVATIVVIGATAGLGRIRVAINEEANDIANAIGSLNQSFLVPSVDDGHCHGDGFVAGSGFADTKDECDCAEIDLGGRVQDHNGTINKEKLAGRG